MKKVRQVSVIHRMYIGFSVMLILFIATVSLTLDGTNRIHIQLEDVNENTLPLVNLANQTSVNLLLADKLFKDFLTSQEPQKMQDYVDRFSIAHKNFSITLQKLAQYSDKHEELTTQLQALSKLEVRYFTAADEAMANYRAQLIAQQERQKANRHFQQLQTDLRVGMIQYINGQENIAIKLMAKNYFNKLKQTEITTSDALSSDDTAAIKKAIKDNKRSATQLEFSYKTLVTQLPSLKEHFDAPTKQFIKDVGRKGGVLDLHFNYIVASQALYSNIAVLAVEVDNAMNILATFRSTADKLMDSTLTQAKNIYLSGYKNAILMSGTVSLFVIFLAWLLTKNVRNPLIHILKTLESLTKGDMTQRIDGKNFIEFNKLSSHVNTLADNLQDILRKLSSTSGQLTQVSKQNQSAMNESKTRINHQWQQTESVSTAMTSMQLSVQDVALRAQNTMEKVQDVETAVNTGSHMMMENIATIRELSIQLDQSMQVVARVQSMSHDIGSILDVIGHIADQTNLLALNAAIEAARAGEQGRGFAVVADEVRVLAKRTAESTEEIERMIDNLQTESKQATSVMQDCVNGMSQNLAQSSAANDSIQDIQNSIIEISEMSAQIAQSADEQQSTTNLIATNLKEIKEIADLNHSAIEQVTRESTQLDLLARAQNELVLRFKV
jgi:methyl-accepting chemotaxis protein